MIKRTTWQPDTCECKIEFEWDSEAPASNRTFTPTQVFATCSRHAGAPNNTTLFARIKGDNNMINDGKKYVIQNLPQLTRTLEDGRVRLDDTKVQFELDGERNMRIIVGDNLTAQEKADLKTALDTELGETDRVLIM